MHVLKMFYLNSSNNGSASARTAAAQLQEHVDTIMCLVVHLILVYHDCT